ncbi:hypothetical protein DPMN_012335 [Dreissena polymorpha]|uniref:Uncharacterized protein n=1 Tax=Dreissena polymorpha TaxID=45954 RepID=A0A9D4N2A9_DREPO|nr:hypothetical protein DPMN_012335 [Dreissena polymorpha]
MKTLDALPSIKIHTQSPANYNLSTLSPLQPRPDLPSSMNFITFQGASTQSQPTSPMPLQTIANEL